MSYILLIHEPKGQREIATAAEGALRYQRMTDFGKGLTARGLLRASESLQSDTGGTRISKREGQHRLVDGPFAEAKEMVGGFFLLEGVTRDEAIEIAKHCPAAEWATVEVRAIAPCFVESTKV